MTGVSVHHDVRQDGMELSAQKCGDAPDTQQAGRSEQSQPGDLLGFNTGPVDHENPMVC